jgi:hypothetical protein
VTLNGGDVVSVFSNVLWELASFAVRIVMEDFGHEFSHVYNARVLCSSRGIST